MFSQKTNNVTTENIHPARQMPTFPRVGTFIPGFCPLRLSFPKKADVSTKSQIPSFCQQEQTKQNKVSRHPNKRIPTIPPYTPGQIFC